ncbi:MAG: TldD/PmbA family protein [Dehalococcoidia bacterium]|nr:TldD/PmbA family protein [Dehalococcoidia bacterium]
MRALDEAVRVGASYADVRVARYRRLAVYAEDERIAHVGDDERYGFGVRVIADGAWGFASSDLVTADELLRIAREAVAIAKASATALERPVSLVPELARQEKFIGPCERNPFQVDMSEKTGLLLDINRRLLAHADIKKAHSRLYCDRIQRLLVTSEGSVLESDTTTTDSSYTATAIDQSDARSRTYHPPPRCAGYEHINVEDLLSNTERVAAQAAEHLRAPDCQPCVTDLVLNPGHLALTMHESIGHPTELDRALGMEESLAGRSFATPDKLGKLKYGSDMMSIIADNTLPGGLASIGFDDEGVAAQCWDLIRDGVFVGYGTSREVAGAIGLARSTGSCRADSYASIPIVRQNNFYLAPGKTPLSPEDLIADTKDGIYIEGRGSFSIDQMRLNFQFGGDAFWRIKDGKLAGMMKNVTYQAITPEFWGAMDAICDERFFVLDGVLNCGKGDPMQVARMSHGAATARFRQIRVGGATA